MPSALARLRATAPSPEGLGPPRRACPEAAAGLPTPTLLSGRPLGSPWGPLDPVAKPARAVRTARGPMMRLEYPSCALARPGERPAPRGCSKEAGLQSGLGEPQG